MSMAVRHAVTISMCIVVVALIGCEASGLRRRSRSSLSKFFERYNRNKDYPKELFRDYGESQEERTANTCPEISPWPCKTPKLCLAFDFICDGKAQCPDGYDEDSALCTAKSRPAQEVLRSFITRYKDWFIPDILGRMNINQLAVFLSESKTIDDFIKAAELTPEEADNLRLVMSSVRQGRSIDLMVRLRLPEGMWPELYYYFGRIVRSGFLDEQP